MGFLDQQVTDRWAIYNGDSMEMMQALPDSSIHAAIFCRRSVACTTTVPMTATCRMPATTASSSTSTTISCGSCGGCSSGPRHRRPRVAGPVWQYGRDSFTDFPGDVIRAHQKRKVEFIGRHVIWKETCGCGN